MDLENGYTPKIWRFRQDPVQTLSALINSANYNSVGYQGSKAVLWNMATRQ